MTNSNHLTLLLTLCCLLTSPLFLTVWRTEFLLLVVSPTSSKSLNLVFEGAGYALFFERFRYFKEMKRLMEFL